MQVGGMSMEPVMKSNNLDANRVYRYHVKSRSCQLAFRKRANPLPTYFISTESAQAQSSPYFVPKVFKDGCRLGQQDFQSPIADDLMLLAREFITKREPASQRMFTKHSMSASLMHHPVKLQHIMMHPRVAQFTSVGTNKMW